MNRYLIFFLITVSLASNPTEDLAQETQHAMCKVMTREIQTSANATITRQLKGVCTTKQMERRFEQLQQILLNEINKIKLLLGLNEPIPTSSLIDNENDLTTITTTRNQDRFTRDLEIDLYNNTLRKINNENVYIYYWKINGVRELLRKFGVHIRSPDLYVLGHQLCLQLYPKYQGRNYFAVQLRPTSNFLKKHQLAIIDINDNSNDIESKIFGDINDNETIFKITNEILNNDDYIINNSLIIKLIIYVNS